MAIILDDRFPRIVETNSQDNTEIEDFPEEDVVETLQRTISVYSGITNQVRAYAFAHCTSLTEVHNPNCTWIGRNAFRSCTELTTIDMPNAAYVGYAAFDDCNKLSNIYLPACKYVDEFAFYGYNSTNGTVDLPECEYVGYAAFGDKHFPVLKLPKVKEIGGFAFWHNTVVNGLDIPECTTIQSGAFHTCYGLSYLSAPKLETINGTFTFFAAGLRELYLPKCKYIGQQVFQGATSHLSKVDLPVCEYIGLAAFYQCRNLKTISIRGNCEIDIQAFDQCHTLSSVYGPNVTILGARAFRSCSALTELSLPKVSYIGEYAFWHCSKLTNCSFPNLKEVGEAPFMTTSLSTVYCPNVEKAGYGGFLCYNFTNLDLPKLTDLGSEVFESCYSLTSINIPKAPRVPELAFKDCYALSTLTLPACSEIGLSAFENCYNLVSLTLPYQSMVRLLNPVSETFISCPIYDYSASAGTFGSIYVPASLYSDYVNDSNWAVLSSRIFSL